MAYLDEEGLEEVWSRMKTYVDENGGGSGGGGTGIDGSQNNAIDDTDITSMITNGTFTTELNKGNVKVGNYILGSYGSNSNVKYRVAHVDYHYGKGDTPLTTHTAAIVPDVCLISSVFGQDNQTSGTTGYNNLGYVGSQMYNSTLPSVLSQIKTSNPKFNIIKHRAKFTNSGSGGRVQGGAWYDCEIFLLNEYAVFGSATYSDTNTATAIDYEKGNEDTQFALFNLDTSKKIGYTIGTTNAAGWWLRSFYGGNGNNWCLVGTGGSPGGYGFSGSRGVRPCFLIG